MTSSAAPPLPLPSSPSVEAVERAAATLDGYFDELAATAGLERRLAAAEDRTAAVIGADALLVLAGVRTLAELRAPGADPKAREVMVVTVLRAAGIGPAMLPTEATFDQPAGVEVALLRRHVRTAQLCAIPAWVLGAAAADLAVADPVLARYAGLLAASAAVQ